MDAEVPSNSSVNIIPRTVFLRKPAVPPKFR
jgi:hypothetical protein